VNNSPLNAVDPLGLLDLVKDPWGLISGGNGKGGDGVDPIVLNPVVITDPVVTRQLLLLCL
jgi:hypothetical protein